MTRALVLTSSTLALEPPRFELTSQPRDHVPFTSGRGFPQRVCESFFDGPIGALWSWPRRGQRPCTYVHSGRVCDT